MEEKQTSTPPPQPLELEHLFPPALGHKSSWFWFWRITVPLLHQVLLLGLRLPDSLVCTFHVSGLLGFHNQLIQFSSESTCIHSVYRRKPWVLDKTWIFSTSRMHLATWWSLSSWSLGSNCSEVSLSQQMDEGISWIPMIYIPPEWRASGVCIGCSVIDDRLFSPQNNIGLLCEWRLIQKVRVWTLRGVSMQSSMFMV